MLCPIRSTSHSTVYGGPGNDRLIGGFDYSYLNGEAGDDFITGGTGTFCHIRDTEGVNVVEGRAAPRRA